MSTHSGDDGHPYSCVLLPIGLTAVNNVIIYDEFSSFHDGFHNIFTFCLFCRLTPCLKAGACAADSVMTLASANDFMNAFNENTMLVWTDLIHMKIWYISLIIWQHPLFPLMAGLMTSLHANHAFQWTRTRLRIMWNQHHSGINAFISCWRHE